MLSWVEHETFIILEPHLAINIFSQDVDRLEKKLTMHRRLIQGSAFSNKSQPPAIFPAT